MLARGQVRRVASLEDGNVRAALQAKYKQRGREMPRSVTKGECMKVLVSREKLS